MMRMVGPPRKSSDLPVLWIGPPYIWTYLGVIVPLRRIGPAKTMAKRTEVKRGKSVAIRLRLSDDRGFRLAMRLLAVLLEVQTKWPRKRFESMSPKESWA